MILTVIGLALVNLYLAYCISKLQGSLSQIKSEQDYVGKLFREKGPMWLNGYRAHVYLYEMSREYQIFVNRTIHQGEQLRAEMADTTLDPHDTSEDS